MKISQETLSLLKNYSTIENSIVIDQGNTLETISKEQNIIAQATISETFPRGFALYDLNLFLAAVNLFKDSEFEFEDYSVKILSGNNCIEYVYCEEGMLEGLKPEIKKLLKEGMNIEPTYSINLSNEELQSLLKAGSTLCLSDLKIECNGKKAKVVVLDTKNPSTNKFSIDLDVDKKYAKKTDCSFLFKFENIKIFPGNYKIDILERESGEISLGRFTCGDLVYHIAVDDIA